MTGTHVASEQTLGRLRSVVQPRLEQVVRDFYARIGRRPRVAEVLARLTPVELERLVVRQTEHLSGLLDPAAEPTVLHDRSRGMGRMYALCGVDMDWYADAAALCRRALDGLVEELVDPAEAPAIQVALAQRFMDDLHGALLGFRDIDAAQNRVMLQAISVVAESRTVPDLVRGVLESVTGLEGLSAGFFARPDADGVIQFEIGAGPSVEDFLADVTEHGPPEISVHGDRSSGCGPVGTAWRTGETVRIDSYLNDPMTAPWRHLGERFGWRSSVAVPLADRRGTTRAVLVLYAAWPGYFAAEGRATMVEQVKQATERTLADLEERPSLDSGVSPFADRAAHLKRLADGDVVMLYQPVVALPTGRTVKLEALARLRGADRLVTPGEFLSAFGDDELFRLFEIGLHQSMESLGAWERAGLTTGVSLNLPVVSAGDGRYVRLVGEALAAYGVAPGRLTLELLETGYVDDEMHGRRRTFDEFKELGVRLAQDDLGTGYSSLTRLRHYAFDEVKIDQSLVRGSGRTPGTNLHFVRPLGDIAHSLGLEVVVEGLETDGLVEAAHQLGADAGQGYAIARPMPGDEVPDWTRERHVDIDPQRPRTPLGALAGHLAWEHRVNAVADLDAGAHVLDLEACPLTGYLAEAGDRPEQTAHQHVHAAAVRHRGGCEHRTAWEHLAGLVAGRD